MQIVVPMSGFGERFRRAGYSLPKPLIVVDGKPIVAHVIDMFPGETDFLFICNQDHLNTPEYAMAETLKRYCPTGRIVGIPPHKTGPIGAVIQASAAIKRDQPVFINYCDFTCYWDWKDFKAFAVETGCDGAVPSYRGFHPHSLGSTFYAYVKTEGLWLTDIQEKKPWSDKPMDEFASSGGYYFKSGEFCLSLFEEVIERELNVNGEYYVSLAYKVLAQRDLKAAVYEIQHFMQWGTPADLEEYIGWSDAFRRLAIDDGRRALQMGSVVVPMAGYGKRFADAGYALTKPLIPVSGRPMVIQATRDLPDAPTTRFVIRADIEQIEEIQLKLRTSFVGVSTVILNEGTQGQAVTCRLGVEGLDLDTAVTFGACDNAMLYDTSKFEALMADEVDLLVWVVRGHADGRMRPQMFGWVDEDENGTVTGVRVKTAPENPKTDAMIVGAFTFAKVSDFIRAFDSLLARDCRVNNEFYVDSMVSDAVALGLKVSLFEIEHYLGWGTPNDLKTFEYWQSCFHKWDHHPYQLENDRRVPTSQVKRLINHYGALIPARP